MLLVSLSGIAAERLDRCAGFAEELAARGVPLALLVRPTIDATAAAWCAEWRAARQDACVVLHGMPTDRSWLRAPRAHEAYLGLVAARAALEGRGLSAECFAPSSHLVSPGTLTALRRFGFRVCADTAAVHDLAGARRVPAVLRGPGAGDPWLARALVLGAARTSRRGRPLRIGVSATALASPGVPGSVLDAVDLALHHGARPTGYPALATVPALVRPPQPHEALWAQTA